MESITYEMAQGMLRAIPSLRDAVAAFFNDHLGKPFPNAPAETEAATVPYPGIIRNAYSQGSMQVGVAADHLMAFSKTMTEPVETIAPWACVRAVLEASALAAWFLDPKITAEVRARRSFAFRFDGLTEQVKYLRASKAEQADIDLTNKRIDDVEDKAAGFGFERVLDKKRNRIGIGMLMPSVTQLITLVFDDEPTFRLLSAMAHGRHWAVQQFGYRPFDKDDGNSDGIILEKHISLNNVGCLSTRAVTAFARPVWYKSRQLGYDMERLRGILESSFDAMRLVEKERFWRNGLSGPNS
jgi:hypothetical protein